MGAQPPDDDNDRSTVAQRVVFSPMARLRRVVVIEGPDAGREFLLDQGAPSRILLGTSGACHLRLTDPTVSRRHAAFEPQGKRYRLSDLGSTNGTFVDGISIVTAYVRGGGTGGWGSTRM